MNLNPFYAYFTYILKSPSSESTIERRTSRKGINYYFIPLSLPEAAFEVTTLGRVQVIENHLSCFENIEEASFFSAIHYTAILNTNSQHIKIHIYFGCDGDIVCVYTKNLSGGEEYLSLKPDDISDLWLAIKPKIQTIHDETYRTRKFLEAEYAFRFKFFEEMFFNEDLDDVSCKNVLEELLLPLESLKLFSLKHRKTFDQFSQILELIQSNKQSFNVARVAEVIDEKFTESEEPAQVEIRNLALAAPLKTSPASIQLRHIQEHLYILKAVIEQTTDKLIKDSGGRLILNPHFQAKFYDLIELYHAIYAELLVMDDLFKTFKIQHLLMQAQLEFDSCVVRIRSFCNEFFETMVLTNQLSAYDYLASIIDKPKAAILIHLEKNQVVDVLVDVLQRHHFSLLEPYFTRGTQNIFELVLANKNQLLFDALIDNFTIDFLSPMSDGRPLAYLILRLLPSDPMRLRCFEEHPQFKNKGFFMALKTELESFLDTHPDTENLEDIQYVVNALQGALERSIFQSYLKEMSFLRIERQAPSILPFLRTTEEMPITFYNSLPGLTQDLLQRVLFIREHLRGYTFNSKINLPTQVYTDLQYLNDVLEEKTLPKETHEALDVFYMHETKKLCR